jgi:hypothetical protein
VLEGWQRYADRLPTQAELTAWAAQYPIPPWNRGLILGPAIGLCMLDVESIAGHGIDGRVALRGKAMPLTLAVRTASEGDHIYYLRPPIPDVPSIPDLLPGVEFRGDRAHVLIPPSRAPRGDHPQVIIEPSRVIPGDRPRVLISEAEEWQGEYTWAVDAPIAELPPWILDRVAPAASMPSGQKAKRRSRDPALPPSESALDHAARIFRICFCGDFRCACARPIRAGRGRGLTHCPSHCDIHPSLSVRIDGSRTLVCCQREPGCPQAQVIANLTLLGAWP